ncbi:MAG: hypothetical protein ACI959_000846 [Limisphaerales bacterium]|jgi:hypothetical protein
MGLLSKLFGKKELIQENVCPNCWGDQEYDNLFIQKYKDQTKDNINDNLENKKAFIAQFVETHVSGIRLVNDRGHKTCPKCHTKFEN